MNNSNCSYLLNPGTEIHDHSLHAIAKSKGLKIASLNVNSLLKHIDEIRVLLEKYTFDILVINESKIDNSIPDNEIHVIGYDLIRNDRNRYGGGVVLYVRDNIPFSVRNDLIPNHLEMVCIEVSRPYNKSFLISTWYRPHQGVIHLGISDHSLVYLVRKFSSPKSRKTAREILNFKNFVESDFIQDISMVPWDMIYQSDNPNICWQIWKLLFHTLKMLKKVGL